MEERPPPREISVSQAVLLTPAGQSGGAGGGGDVEAVHASVFICGAFFKSLVQGFPLYFLVVIENRSQRFKNMYNMFAVPLNSDQCTEPISPEPERPDYWTSAIN